MAGAAISSTSTGSASSDGVVGIVSVDDHVVEPPDLWTARMPKARVDTPKLVREKGLLSTGGGWHQTDDGEWADVWRYGPITVPLTTDAVAIGGADGHLEARPVTFDDIPVAAWKPRERVEHLAASHVAASVNFPNLLPGSCGETFSTSADRAGALLCIRAYNDWLIEEWCAGAAEARLLPVTLVPLWDPEAASTELMRCAAKGSRIVSFPESSYALGFDSLHSRRWDFFFAACQETRTTVAIHRDTSGQSYHDDPHAPRLAMETLGFQFGLHALIDVIVSGIPERYPELTFILAEQNVGWMPYVLERLDHQFAKRKGNPQRQMALAQPPSSYVPGRIFGCVIDDVLGVCTSQFGPGLDQLTLASNYPRAGSSVGTALGVAAEIQATAGLDEEEMGRLMRGNAMRALRLETVAGL